MSNLLNGLKTLMHGRLGGVIRWRLAWAVDILKDGLCQKYQTSDLRVLLMTMIYHNVHCNDSVLSVARLIRYHLLENSY